MQKMTARGLDILGRKRGDYSGCHKYVPFARFSYRRQYNV
jgi:hypothetical protein